MYVAPKWTVLVPGVVGGAVEQKREWWRVLIRLGEMEVVVDEWLWVWSIVLCGLVVVWD